ncbi:MAG: nitroreductase family protein [Anaerolineae bacterium]|nr:nitroreductase family protein [Anaerolineae bacterium]
MNVHDAIESRRAVRLFSDTPVPEHVVEQILAGGRRSQSSKNSQPWQFIVVRDKDRLKALSKLGDFAGHVAGADFAVCLVGTKQTQWNSFDLGQAAAYLQLAAHEFGVGSCIAAMYDEAAAKALLNIPAEMNFFCVISFGYPSADHKPAKLGGRKPLADVVRRETW